MTHKYRTPLTSTQNVVSFTCSDGALETVLEVLRYMQTLGQLGGTREIVADGLDVEFDGDGDHKLGHISVNGLSMPDWQDEWLRLAAARDWKPSPKDTDESAAPAPRQRGEG
jgi:hypothetical protein